MDVATISALVLSIVSALAIFIKKISKCKCGDIEIERENDITFRQQTELLGAMLTIIKTNFTPRKSKTTREELGTPKDETIYDMESGTKQINSPKKKFKIKTGKFSWVINKPSKKNHALEEMHEVIDKTQCESRRCSKNQEKRVITPHHTISDIAEIFGLEPKKNIKVKRRLSKQTEDIIPGSTYSNKQVNRGLPIKRSMSYDSCTTKSLAGNSSINSVSTLSALAENRRLSETNEYKNNDKFTANYTDFIVKKNHKS